MRKLQNQSGTMLLVALIATTVFLASIGGLATLGAYQQKLYLQQSAKHQAIHIAEAGVNYYRWLLSHNHEDFFDGTGSDPGEIGEPYGPYEHSYTAPSSGIQGTYILEITPPEEGSTIVKIKSTGWVNNYPNVKRTIEVRYGIPSIAHYSFLTNSDVWFGEDENISGELHSNGGIRIDGPNDSVVTSARDTYVCTSSHGCSSSNCNSPCEWVSGTGCECPGVWGAGPNFDLWNFPVPAVDFNAITMDIAEIKSEAQTDGFYFGSSGGGNDGYHIIFLAEGIFDVYVVNSLKSSIWQLNDSWSNWKKSLKKSIQKLIILIIQFLIMDLYFLKMMYGLKELLMDEPH